MSELYFSLKESLAAAHGVSYEVLTVVNGPDPALTPLTKDFAEAENWRFIDLPEAMPPPQARNEGIRLASGEWIVFFDDDITLPPHYISTLVQEIARAPQAVVVGGPNLNPARSTAFESVTGMVLGTKWITGPFASRYSKRGFSHATKTDCCFILCNLAIRAASAWPFPPDVPLGEENAMILELKGEIKNLLFVPELYVYHRRRAKVSELIRQIYKYGKGRGILLRRYGLAAPSNRLLVFGFALLAGFLRFIRVW